MSTKDKTHADGHRFYNVPHVSHGAKGMLRWMATRKPGKWPKWRYDTPGPPPPSRVEGDNLRVTLVNHSTVLLQTRGLNILTDPVWSKRVGPFPWAGMRRRRPPGLRKRDVPTIDIVLISHNHYDHCDLPTLKWLVKRDDPEIYCPLGVPRTLGIAGIKATAEMDWWSSVEAKNGMKLTCLPAQHGSGRDMADQSRTLWCSFMLDAVGGSIYFAGDTGFGPHFQEIAADFMDIRLALLPIGAYKPRWFMRPVHMDPAEAVDAHQLLNARNSVAIHYGTFPLADDGENDASHELEHVVHSMGIENFELLQHGIGRQIR